MRGPCVAILHVRLFAHDSASDANRCHKPLPRKPPKGGTDLSMNRRLETQSSWLGYTPAARERVSFDYRINWTLGQ